MSKRIDDGKTNQQRWYERNNGRERSRARGAKWRKDHPEASLQATRKYYANHAEERRQRARDYYYRVRAKRLRTDAEKLRDRLSKEMRRQIASDTSNPLTAEEWHVICKVFAQRCAYCGRQEPLEQDHVVPVSRGGLHTQNNVVPACKSCNSSKGNRGNWPIHIVAFGTQTQLPL